MPIVTATSHVTCKPDVLFDFLTRPANALAISSPELNLRLIDAPDQVRLGSLVVMEARRYGLSQRIVSEITEFELGLAWTEEQREGPFRKWRHRRELRAVVGEAATRMRDAIEFEPPGGLLGLAFGSKKIEAEVREAFVYRSRKLAELMGVDAALVHDD